MPYYSTKGRGSGLGLAIVRRIVVEHGGGIEVGEAAAVRHDVHRRTAGRLIHVHHPDCRRRSRRARVAGGRAARRRLQRGRRRQRRGVPRAGRRGRPTTSSCSTSGCPASTASPRSSGCASGAIDAQVIMISGHASVEAAVRATKLGAFDFIEKPLSLEKTVLAVRNALRAAPARGREPRAARARRSAAASSSGDSAAMVAAARADRHGRADRTAAC